MQLFYNTCIHAWKKTLPDTSSCAVRSSEDKMLLRRQCDLDSWWDSVKQGCHMGPTPTHRAQTILAMLLIHRESWWEKPMWCSNAYIQTQEVKKMHMWDNMGIRIGNMVLHVVLSNCTFKLPPPWLYNMCVNMNRCSGRSSLTTSPRFAGWSTRNAWIHKILT